jgi:hypothetical protein
MAVAMLLSGCAAEIVREPAELGSGPSTSIQIKRLATVVLPTGYQRSLLTGSRWQRIGTIRQGSVFRPVDTVFTIEGANTHEAYIVVRETQLVGFYLPGERAYSGLPSPVDLDFAVVPGREK